MMVEWLTANWLYCIAGLWVAEKIVKLTPTPYDDILIDIIGGGLKKLVGKGKSNV